ncbi:MAG: hypothetical protein ACREDY_24530 [Bradyrhizobium sp.]
MATTTPPVSLLTQIIALMMHAPVEEAKRVLDVAHAILDARKVAGLINALTTPASAQLSQPALPGTTAGTPALTSEGKPRRKPGPKPKAAVADTNEAVDAATASVGKGPRRVPQNKMPGAGRPSATDAATPAVAADGLPMGDAELPDQSAGDEVGEPVLVGD